WPVVGCVCVCVCVCVCACVRAGNVPHWIIWKDVSHVDWLLEPALDDISSGFPCLVCSQQTPLCLCHCAILSISHRTAGYSVILLRIFCVSTILCFC
ncbi:hypothetical protein LDENG_00177470, partial [Lucifuga dentata]